MRLTLEKSICARDRKIRSVDQRRLCLARWEHSERIDGASAVVTRAFDCVGERVGRFQQADRVIKIVVGYTLAVNCRTPERALDVIAPRISKDHRQGHLAVAKIVTDALAHDFGVRRIVDHVVAQLEGDTEVSTKAFERMLSLFARLGNDGRNPACRRKQGRGLRAYDLDVMLFVVSI